MELESNSLENEFGYDCWERLERFMPTESHTIDRWATLHGEFKKYLK